MKIKEALFDWKKHPDMAEIAIDTLKRRGVQGKRLQMFVAKYSKLEKEELAELLKISK